eukprot:5111102-Amphidinium_carterae.1
MPSCGPADNTSMTTSDSQFALLLQKELVAAEIAFRATAHCWLKCSAHCKVGGIVLRSSAVPLVLFLVLLFLAFSSRLPGGAAIAVPFAPLVSIFILSPPASLITSAAFASALGGRSFSAQLPSLSGATHTAVNASSAPRIHSSNFEERYYVREAAEAWFRNYAVNYRD